jgi:acyl-CoA thioesterase-1
MRGRGAIEKSKEVKKMMRRALLVSACGVALLLVALATNFSATPPMQPKEAGREEPARSGPVIVALGDSLTAGWNLPQKDAFPAQLEAALRARGKNVTVVNAGVSGDMVSSGLARVDWSIPLDTSAVIIELGANDALLGLDPAATRTTLEKLITHIQKRRLPILLAGMEAPRNLGKEYTDAFRAMYRELAEKHDLVFYPFFLEGVALDEKLSFPDGIHPNAEGVARIVEGILPKVEELLARTEATPVGAFPPPQ